MEQKSLFGSKTLQSKHSIFLEQQAWTAMVTIWLCPILETEANRRWIALSLWNTRGMPNYQRNSEAIWAPGQLPRFLNVNQSAVFFYHVKPLKIRVLERFEFNLYFFNCWFHFNLDTFKNGFQKPFPVWPVLICFMLVSWTTSNLLSEAALCKPRLAEPNATWL